MTIEDGQAEFSANLTLNQTYTELSANATIQNESYAEFSVNATIQNESYAEFSVNVTVQNKSEADLSANATIQNESYAELSANCRVMRDSSDDLSANFTVGIDVHVYMKIFKLKGSEASTESLHDELTIWLNSRDLVNKTFRTAGIIPFGLSGHFAVLYICQ